MLRNLLFKIFYYFSLILIFLIFIPTLFLPVKVVHIGGKFLGYWTKVCLKVFMSIMVEVRGLKNINKNQKFFIACSHQSIFETFFLQTLFDRPVFILKKELIKIPLFGLYLKKIGCISIDRGKISKENLNFFSEVSNIIRNTNKTLIIFPQGTRKHFKDRSKFKKGVSRIYKDLNIPCLPISINSGEAWPKEGRLIPGKKIIVSVLNLYPSNLDPQDFLVNIEKLIYKELDNLS